jgi:two-component system phosphate regulon sensor histidine kinase PhoR
VRRDFVANVSHELRTPVTAIQGYAETLLAEPVDDGTRRRFLEVIHRNAQRIGRLVEDLLDLSALEARRNGEPARDRVELGPITEHVVRTLEKRAEEGGTRVELAVEADATVMGDAAAVERVVLNLVENALKYGGGSVRVVGRRAGRAVELVVSDDGPGIDAVHLSRIFERFYRVDPGRSRALGGTGLGLAIVKHLVESMRGTVTAESAAGAGARFTVTLPAAT